MHANKNKKNIIKKDLVLLGAGHSNIEVLKKFGTKPIDGLRLTLISNSYFSTYSGMIPGYLQGIYDWNEINIDLVKLCRVYGHRLIISNVIKLMHIRIMKYKFPSETKANLFISLIKAQMYDEYKNRSECLSVEFIKTGEGQLLSIARYNTKKDFDETNKWSGPIFKKNVQELDGVVESIPGDLISSYFKN